LTLSPIFAILNRGIELQDMLTESSEKDRLNIGNNNADFGACEQLQET
jgi:hypothetical protein